jgi:hypothetical protein
MCAGNVAYRGTRGGIGRCSLNAETLRVGGPIEADGELAMLRLVGRAPEEFAHGVGIGAEPLKQGRFNTQALYRALDTERRERGLSWEEASREIGAWGDSALRRLANGGRISVDLMLACTWWLGDHVNDFVDPDFEHRAVPPEVTRKLGG